MNKYTVDEIINAVTVVKEVCSVQSCCCTCPFCKGGICIINEESPEEWEIERPEYSIFR